MTTFYVFRHGNTKNTESKNLVVKLITKNGGGPINLPILPKGKYALRKIGEYLKDKNVDTLFTSPYLRCRQSAKVVSDVIDKKFIVDERIRELRSDTKGFLGFKKRVNDFLKEVDKKNYSSVAICTHGAVIAAIKYLVTKGKFYYFQGTDFPEPGKMLIIRDQKVRTLDFNKK